MFSFTSRFALSQAGSTANSSFVSFGTDLSQDPAFLEGEVKKSSDFAKAMLVLGQVVRTNDDQQAKDRSAYQAWVRNEYVKELPQAFVAAQQKLPGLLEEKKKLHAVIDEKSEKVASLRQRLYISKRKYYDWLYATNRQMWFVLDPIVSVQKEATYFEAFSQDESVYARVSLPHRLLAFTAKPKMGTTNIDFSIPLEREFARARSYRPLSLTIGQRSVTVGTENSGVVEKKIDLPETWVRGLVEVQAALPLTQHSLEIEPLLLSAVLAQLESKKERRGPRAMRIVAQRGEVVKAILEPWGISFPLTLTPWQGKQEFDIKVWGRRRLRALGAVLPVANKLSVSLIADGMPTYWCVDMGGVELTLGLSGWTAQDWASKARFSALTPTSSVTEEQTQKALDALIKLVAVTPQSFAEDLGVKPAVASSYLQKLTLIGAAMYDRNSGQYLHRQLFPQLDLTRNDEASREERFGITLNAASAVTISSTLRIRDSKEYRATVVSEKETNSVVLSKDEDLRVTYAQCNCSFFNFNKLKLGPCRHIVATSLAVDSL